MKKLVGFDLNGWNDFAAKNWLEVPGQETIEDVEQVVHGGVGGAVVKVSEAAKTDGFVGGMQALRAPHGRGEGWGVIGDENRRLSVRAMLEDPTTHVEALASALSSMAASRKATTVLAIPDLPHLSEEKQEALLRCLQFLRAGRRLLVWRSVLSVLAALSDFDISTWKEGQKVGVVQHHSTGFAVQVLRLRFEGQFAPERKTVGRLVESDCGLDRLIERANEIVKGAASNPDRADHVMASNLPCRFALGQQCSAEPMRQWNGRWEVVEPPESFKVPHKPLPTAISDLLSDADVILFDTPAVGKVRDQLCTLLKQAVGQDVFVQSSDAVARGGLEAARRLSSDEPIYYDFLPQISTIVQDADGAKNYNLIPAGELLRAGQSYRSSRPARLGLVAGMEEIKVFIKRETDDQPRRAILPLLAPPQSNTVVELNLQQTPASGRARLTLVSEVFSAPMAVDWEASEPLEASWEEIIASLEPSKPSVPNRLVLPCGRENWFENERGLGLSELLEENVENPLPDWKTLKDKLSMRPFKKYSISSDGEYPSELADASKNLLEKAVKLAEEDVRMRLQGKGTQDNHSLNFLTWLFRKCPAWVVPKLLDGLEAETGQHPFVQVGGNRTLMLQGVGRTANSLEDQRRAFEHLLSLPLARWKKDQMACAAFLLSRTDSAPLLLNREAVEFIAKVAENKIREAVGQEFSARYSYGPYLLVGLLRWRLKDPWALVAGKDPLADRLLGATKELVAYLKRRVASDPRLVGHHQVLTQVCEELEGKGSNPDLLVDLESLTRG